MTRTLDVHPDFALFPPMDEEELRRLADDIRENGLLEPIELYEGKILDGRNRYQACLLVGVKPTVLAWEPDGRSPLAYVLAKNLHRRHLTIAQRAALAVDLLPRLREEAKERQVAGLKQGDVIPVPTFASERGGEAPELAARLVGVGQTSVKAADLIARHDPETFEEMKKGEISVAAAARKAGVGTGTFTPRQKQGTKRRGAHHLRLVEMADKLGGLEGRWTEEMCEDLAPPQARKQLRRIERAISVLERARVAVEYRAATMHSWGGR